MTIISITIAIELLSNSINICKMLKINEKTLLIANIMVIDLIAKTIKKFENVKYNCWLIIQNNDIIYNVIINDIKYNTIHNPKLCFNSILMRHKVHNNNDITVIRMSIKQQFVDCLSTHLQYEQQHISNSLQNSKQ